jgi:glycosyltransferase involved in cell wall biosynthesis
LLTKCCDGVEYSSADPLRDEEKMLAEAVLMLLTDKNLAKRYSDASMEAVSVFDIEKVEKKWLDVIGDRGEV